MTIDLESLRDLLWEIDNQVVTHGIGYREVITRTERVVSEVIAELTARRARDAEVEALVAAAKRANGDHTAPHDCYATGPSTGDDYLDLVSCPGCELAAAILPFAGDKT